MMDFDTAYHPHILCLIYDYRIVALHVISDLLIMGAYLGIPLLVWHFARRRHDFPFCRLLAWTGAFIILCGCTHFGNALEVWIPAYTLTGVVKLATAVVSWITLLQLKPIIRVALRLPSLQQMHDLRQWLERPVPECLEEMRQNLEQLIRVIEPFMDARQARRAEGSGDG